MKKSPPLLDYLKIHFIVVIYAFTAILGKAITANALSVVFFRCLMASLALYGLLLILKVPLRARKRVKRIWYWNGLFIALHWLLFFGAAKVSNVAMCLAGLSTQTFWTSILEPWYQKQSIKKVEVFLGILVILALGIIFWVEQAQALGLLMGIGAGFFGALFSVINGRFTHQYDPRVVTLYEIGVAGLITGLVWCWGFAQGLPDFIPSLWDWLWMGALALVCTVYAYTETIRLYRVFSVFSINLVITLEPVYGIILAFLIFGQQEVMHAGFYWGTALLLFTVGFHPFLNAKTKA